jgi:streptogramin lyase
MGPDDLLKFTAGSVTTTVDLASNPADVARDGAGNLWVVEQDAHQVSKVSPAGVVVGSYPLGAGTSPKAITCDPLGNLWIVCGGTNTVKKLSPTGTVLGTYSPGGTPNRVVFDRHRAAWVSQSGTNSVTKLAL